MFTTFKNHQNAEKQRAVQKPDQRVYELLREALHNCLNENTDRVYIENIPHLVEFKSEDKADLSVLKTLVENNKVRLLENKVVGGEILVHVFQILPGLENIEVWYRPQSRPRI